MLLAQAFLGLSYADVIGCPWLHRGKQIRELSETHLFVQSNHNQRLHSKKMIGGFIFALISVQWA